MLVAIDYDGTITANYIFFAQLTRMMSRSGHKILIISGCNPKRKKEVYSDLEKMGIVFDEIITRPEYIKTGSESIGRWKHDVLLWKEPDLWFDNEVKNYEQAGVNFSDLNTEIVRI